MDRKLEIDRNRQIEDQLDNNERKNNKDKIGELIFYYV